MYGQVSESDLVWAPIYLVRGINFEKQLFQDKFGTKDFIAFFQSGLDKVIDRKGNLYFLKAHFSDSPLIKIIPIMLLVLTFLEISGSLMLGYGVYYALVNRSTLWIFYGFVVIAITTIILFAGQRVAKDYLGAADLVPYFILIMLGIMSMY